jgi:hypothetical protein
LVQQSFLLILSSIHGWNYGQLEPAPKVAFQSDLAMRFERYIEATPCSTRIFTAHQTQQFIWFIEHPDQNLGPELANAQAFALRSFEVDDGCLYRKEDYKPDGNGGITTISRRYVAQQHNAFRFIIDIHRLLQHFGIQKTYERVMEWYYSITRNDMAWVVNRCTICNLKGVAKGSTLINPIVASWCINRFQIDLMDFSTTLDGNYN